MKKSLFFGMAALIAAGLASCSNNEDLLGGVDQTKPLDADQSFYVNVDINSTDAFSNMWGKPGMQRAGQLVTDPTQSNYDPEQEPDFNAGEGNENEVKTIYLIFYDKDRNRVATTQVRRDNGFEGSGRNESENKFYSGVVQVDIKHGSLPPAYVMCFINPITSQNFEMNPNFATMHDLEATMRPSIIDKNDNFAMSKSVYYGVDRSREDYDAATMEGNEQYYEKIIATPIGKGQLFTSIKDAQDAIAKDKEEGENQYHNSSVVDVYVERYAAKVNFEIADNAQLVLEGVDGRTLTFVPEYWAVNAYEDQTYICKSFLSEDMSTDLSYQAMNDSLRGKAPKAWVWNSPAHHRSYWAQSPAYYAQEYPRVADDILDKEATYGNAGYALGYYSYNDMVTNATGKLADKARKAGKGEDKKMIYVRENTVSGNALKKAFADPLASPKAAIASVVLVGHYEVAGGKSKAGELEDDDTFYVMGNATNGYHFYDTTDDMKEWFMNITIPFAISVNRQGEPTQGFYDQGIEEYGWNENGAEYAKYFTVIHPTLAARTYGINDIEKAQVVDSRFVTIQLNEAEILKYYNEEGHDASEPVFYASVNGTYIPVTEDNIELIQQQMFFAAGLAQGFQGGKAYFNIPIKHLGYYRSDNVNKETSANNKDFKWGGVQSGDFGLVRNHVYSIIVDNITGLGNGIPDPSVPIVPPTDPEEYFIGARIIVLNWAVVPAQHETL